MALYTIDKNTTAGRLGNFLQNLDATFLRIQQFKVFLDTIPDSTLITSYGFVQADLDVMRSALTDLEQLHAIYQGTATLPVAKDFRTFAKQVYAYGSL